MALFRSLLLFALPLATLSCRQATPVQIPSDAKLLIMAPAPFNFPAERLPDCTLYYVDDFSGEVIAALPYRKGSNVSVNGLKPGRKYRVYLSESVLKPS